MRLSTVSFLALMLFQPAVCWGQDFDKGVVAYQRGNYAAALKQWRPLANQGDASAQNNLGVMYALGLGVVRDYAEAVKWYRKAANQGNVSAQNNLGTMYYIGQGVLQEYVQAHTWWNIAAAKGNKNSVKNRDMVANLMTPTQIAEAQRMARDWVAAFNKRRGK
jgi:uncharacterized protein